MAKAITQTELNKIAKMIREWSDEDKFNWENICLGSKNIIGYIPTRQALSGKPILKHAYLIKRKNKKTALEQFENIPRPQSIVSAMKKIGTLQAENNALRLEIAVMSELANIFIYNASIKGLSYESLTAPLPKKYND